jgi:hypothetical protein
MSNYAEWGPIMVEATRAIKKVQKGIGSAGVGSNYDGFIEGSSYRYDI